MLMNQVTAAEFQHNLAKYQREAQLEPVEITNHGQRDLVLVSAEYFDWLNAAAKRAHRTEDGGSAFMLEAVKTAKMAPEHGGLNAELD